MSVPVHSYLHQYSFCGIIENRTHPVDFVQIIRFHDDGADDPGAIGCSHDDLDLAEEDVKVGLKRRRIVPLVDGEFGSVAAVGDIARDGRPSIRAALGEIGG